MTTTKSESSHNSFVNRCAREFLSRRHMLKDFSQKAIENLAAYEEAEERRRQALIARADEPDEEGFFTVVNKRPKVVFEAPATLVPTFNVVTSNPNDDDDGKILGGAQVRTYKNFYKTVGRAQERERTKRIHITLKILPYNHSNNHFLELIDLRRRFERDLSKLEEMKQTRLFNPFN